MVVSKDRDVECRMCVRNRKDVVEENAAVGEGIGYRGRIPMDGSDDIGAGSEILGAKRMQRTGRKHCGQCEVEYPGHP